ncbi:uncharacterized protein LOC112097984 [Citrus clementina]|uniref:uncharacterized protein LOC112097984 n=1 Tax=Citrus clementina TaxID=85681 RepID=UPI0007638B74|nr:uncharacterized protein LOC112097984 [Citrus x clementina]
MSKAIWDQIEPAFINAANEYRHEEFKRQLEGLWMLHSGAADYLENNVGTCNWARSEFEGGGMKEGIVDIHERICSCRVFQLDQLVCAHAIAVCLSVRVDYISLCSDYYSKHSLVMAYAEPVEPVGDMTDWDILEEIQEIRVNPLIKAPPPGRRPELRIPSIGEDVNRRTVRCGRCNQPSHNRKRCKNLIVSNPN